LNDILLIILTGGNVPERDPALDSFEFKELDNFAGGCFVL
jgi:hypothetical protein